MGPTYIFKNSSHSKISYTFYTLLYSIETRSILIRGEVKKNPRSELPIHLVFRSTDLMKHLLRARYYTFPGNMVVNKKDVVLFLKEMQKINKRAMRRQERRPSSRSLFKEGLLWRGDVFNRRIKKEKVLANAEHQKSSSQRAQVQGIKAGKARWAGPTLTIPPRQSPPFSSPRR